MRENKGDSAVRAMNNAVYVFVGYADHFAHFIFSGTRRFKLFSIKGTCSGGDEVQARGGALL